MTSVRTIVFLFYDIHRLAGIQRSICDAANLLDEIGYNCEIIVGEHGISHFKLSKNVKVTYLNMKEPLHVVNGNPLMFYFFKRIIWSLRFIKKVVVEASKIKADIIVDHGTSLGLIYPFKMLVGRPFVLLRHFSIDQFPNAKALKTYWKYFCKNKNFVVLDDLYKAQLNSIGITNVCIIRNFSSYPTQPKLFGSTKYMLAVGRPSSQKGFDLLINGFNSISSNHCEWKLLIVGPDISNNLSLKRASIENKNIELIDGVSDIAKYYKKASLLVIPSRWEGVPYVLLEAASSGVPILLSDIDIFRSIVNDSPNSDHIIFLPIDDQKKFTHMLDTYLRSSENLEESKKLSEFVNLKYSKERVVDDWKAFICAHEK